MQLTLQEFEKVLEANSKFDPKNPSYWLLVEEGRWEQEGKYQIQKSIVKHIPTDTNYEYEIARTGSSFSSWDYLHENEEYIYLTKVKMVQVVTTKWVPC